MVRKSITEKSAGTRSKLNHIITPCFTVRLRYLSVKFDFSGSKKKKREREKERKRNKKKNEYETRTSYLVPRKLKTNVKASLTKILGLPFEVLDIQQQIHFIINDKP